MVAKPDKRVHAKAVDAFLWGNSKGNCKLRNVCRVISGSLAATLLVLLPGAAGTGIVAADFAAAAEGLWRFGLSRTGLILQILLLAALSSLQSDCSVGKCAWPGNLAAGANGL